MPESLAEPWLPFELGNSVNVAILSDVHIPYHSKVAFESAVKHTKRRKPDVLLLNGDFADFYTISRHQKDPSKRDFKQEMQMIRDGLAWLRHEYGKDCRFVYKLGNHEERWQHYLWNAAPEISDDPRMDIGEWIDAKQHGVEVVGDQRPVMVGKLPVLHGHESGKASLAPPVNPARGLFLKTLSTMLVGHGHRTSQHSETDWRHKQTSCWSTGCLCEMNPVYWRMGNRWNWGAAHVEVDSSSDFEVDNFRLGPGGEYWK
jgi:predicted phosphodiesterase